MSLRNEAITIWKRLGEAIRGIFMELENLISRDPAKMAVPGGGLHPITRYVMNYLCAACRSRQTLEQVFEDYGLKEYPKLDDRVSSACRIFLGKPSSTLPSSSPSPLPDPPSPSTQTSLSVNVSSTSLANSFRNSNSN